MKKTNTHLRHVGYGDNKRNINFHFKVKNRKYIFKSLFRTKFYTVNKIFYFVKLKNRIRLNRENKMLREIEKCWGNKTPSESLKQCRNIFLNILRNIFFVCIYLNLQIA